MVADPGFHAIVVMVLVVIALLLFASGSTINPILLIL